MSWTWKRNASRSLIWKTTCVRTRTRTRTSRVERRGYSEHVRWWAQPLMLGRGHARHGSHRWYSNTSIVGPAEGLSLGIWRFPSRHRTLKMSCPWTGEAARCRCPRNQEGERSWRRMMCARRKRVGPKPLFVLLKVIWRVEFGSWFEQEELVLGVSWIGRLN